MAAFFVQRGKVSNATAERLTDEGYNLGERVVEDAAPYKRTNSLAPSW